MALKDRLAAVRARIVADVQGAVPAGTPVYDYYRDMREEATRAAVFADGGGRLHTWMLNLASEAPTVVDVLGAGHSQGRFNFELHGFFALADANATEKTWDSECCDVIEAFRVDKYLGGNAINCWPVSRAQGGWVQFASVLCHYARLTVPVQITVEC